MLVNPISCEKRTEVQLLKRHSLKRHKRKASLINPQEATCARRDKQNRSPQDLWADVQSTMEDGGSDASKNSTRTVTAIHQAAIDEKLNTAQAPTRKNRKIAHHPTPRDRRSRTTAGRCHGRDEEQNRTKVDGKEARETHKHSGKREREKIRPNTTTTATAK